MLNPVQPSEYETGLFETAPHLESWPTAPNFTAAEALAIDHEVSKLQEKGTVSQSPHTLCGGHLQSLKMASAQVVETSVTNSSPSQDSRWNLELGTYTPKLLG